MNERPELLAEVLSWLAARRVPHRHLHHPTARSTEAFARFRGRSPADALKALLVKAGRDWWIVALRAHLQLDNAALRHALHARRLRFATPEELGAILGLEPGQVPPLGEPFLPVPLLLDGSVRARPEVAFTAGTRTDSVILATADYLAHVPHELADFSRAP